MRHASLSQVNAPAAQLVPTVPSAANHVLSALAELFDAAKLEGVEPPREAISELRRWAFGRLTPSHDREEAPMTHAATRLVNTIADVLEVADLQGIQVPRRLLSELGVWGIAARVEALCVNCGEPAFLPDAPRLCRDCAPLLRPAFRPGGDAA